MTIQFIGKKVLMTSVFVAVLIVTYMWYVTAARAPEESPLKEDVLYTVTRVLDGDTFSVKDVTSPREFTIRMLGINTPETVDPRKPPECFGTEASDETKKLLKDARVFLTFSPKREVIDRYGRYLAYVVREDGVRVNEYLLEKGLAREYTYDTAYSKQKVFRTLEEGAKREKQGLWAECTTPHFGTIDNILGWV
jgi:micrococcal nuclease